MKTDLNISEEVKEQLNIALSEYYKYNSEYKTVKNNKDTYNDRIKQLLTENNLKQYVSKDGIKASISEINKPSFDEESLIEYLKPFNIPDLIKTKEYVDMEILEDCLYHKQIEPSALVPFKSDNISIRLNISKPKQLNE